MSLGVIASHYSGAPALTGYAAEVMADSPLAYWRLGDASGTTMADSSGNSRHGTYAGSPTLGAAGLLTGDPDTCVDFDGTNDLASVTTAAWMNVNVFTIEAIVRPDVVTGDRIIASRTNWDVAPSNTGRSWHLIIQGGQFNVGLTMTDGSNHDAKVGPALTAGTEYHVALTRPATGSAVLYVNGASAWSSATLSGKTLTAPGRDLCISAEGFYKSIGLFDGKIDEVAFYGTALSAARIAAHYAAA